ncbi:hypothetical protein LDENG_00239780 [Lucifuga dentata]|nr:hypothetical protein LDENG_00239780 [Lucifuga dentata]
MSNTDVWVGSWRPHKPRGPVAAECSGPGPKYALPGLTGGKNHDPSKFKEPEYSFGIRHHQVSAEASPGPKYCIPNNITKVGPDGTPAFSLYSRPKEPELFKSPAPGQYYPEHSGKSVFFSAPAYSLSGRSRDLRAAQTPGPDAYMLPSVLGPSTVAKTAAPTYSLCGRSKVGSFYEDHQKTPGPGAYKTTDPGTYKQKAPHYSMIGRNVMPGDTTKTPGPAAYHPGRNIGQDGAPAFSLYSRPKEPELFRSPAPSQYFPERSGKSVFHCPPAYSLSSRSRDLRATQTPGPAAYMLPSVLGPNIVAKTTAPTYSLCGRSKVGSFYEDHQKTPGPGAYKTTNPCIYKQKAPHYSMIGRNVMPGDTTKTPGPAAYHPGRRIGQGGAPAFSLYSRPKEPGMFKSPGPGQYSLEHSGKSVFHSPPAYSLSGRSRDLHAAQTPGPAAYMLPSVLGPNTVAKTAAPTYSLCGRSKFGSFYEDHQMTPGPGAYKMVDPSAYKQKAPHYSLTFRDVIPGDTTKTPGPAAYHPGRDIGQDGTPAFSLYSRPKEPQPFKSPAPGQYFPEHSGKSVFHSPPAYSLSSRNRDLRAAQTPGPAAYMLPSVLGPNTVAKTAAPTYSLCGRSKVGSFYEDHQKTPGPGAYKTTDPGTYKQKYPHFSMTGRNVIPGDTTTKPGPGAHYPERVTCTKEKGPSYTFGVHHSPYVAPLIVDVVE